jgi:glutaredoxin
VHCILCAQMLWTLGLLLGPALSLCPAPFLSRSSPSSALSLYLSQSKSQPAASPLSSIHMHVSNTASSRLEVYSSPGCKYCRLAKQTLDSLQLPYLEIDVSSGQCKVRPASSSADSSKPVLAAYQINRLQQALHSTVPQIYVDEVHIGGYSDLQNLLDSADSDLYRRISSLPKMMVTDIAAKPLDAASVDISSYLPTSTQEALNSPRFSRGETQYSDIRDLVYALQSQALALLDLHSSGRKVDYKALRVSPVFLEYISLSTALARAEIVQQLPSLHAEDRIALLCNLYNALLIHAVAVYGYPESPEGRSNFFSGRSGANYLLGQHVFSLDDLEHGLIRANLPHPSKAGMSSTYFSEGDPRAVFALDRAHFDPRVHFVLNCGAASCPPLRVLSRNTLQVALAAAARSYLKSEVCCILTDISNCTKYGMQSISTGASRQC